MSPSFRDVLVTPAVPSTTVCMATLQNPLDTSFVKSSLNRLSQQEAWELLTKLVGTQRIGQDDLGSRPVVFLLCKWLGYQPLGIELVGRYLAEHPHLSLGEMLKRLHAQRQENEAIDLSNPPMQSALNTAQRGVKAALELIWQELDPMEQHVATFLSLFATDVIPWRLVELASEQLSWVKAELNQAKQQLYQWRLIQSVEAREDCYQLHPFIRQFLQTKLTASGQADKLKRGFVASMVLIAQQIPDSPTPTTVESVQEAIPHLVEVTQTWKAAVRDEELLWLFDRLGNFYKGQGLYELAKPWFFKCLYLAKARLGKDHPDVATSLNNLAGLYYAQGDYGEAERLYLQALNLRKFLLGKNRPEVATTLNNLASLYYTQGRYSEAEPLYLEALKLRKRFQRNDSSDVATALNNLALLYYAQRRYGEAEPLYLEALKLRQRRLGTNHLDVATTLNNLASLYEAQGRYSEAEPLLVQALQVSEQVLGSNHPTTIIFHKNLMTLQSHQKASQSWFQHKLTKKLLTFVPRRNSKQG